MKKYSSVNDSISQFTTVLVFSLGVLCSPSVYPYAFDSFGGLKDRWGLPQPENKRWSDASFSWWYDETTEPLSFQGHQNDARTGMDYWSIWSNITVPTTEAASAQDADIRISWAALTNADGTPNTSTIADAGPKFDSATGNLLYSQMRFNTNLTGWTTTGFLDVIQHEFGHSIGLVDMYDDNSNSVIDFVDHPAGGDKAAKPHDLMADNVMYGYGSNSAASVRLFDNDDMYGANWLFGGPINTIATAAWETTLGSDPNYLNYYKVADHHGITDGTPEHTWQYATSIGIPIVGTTTIEIEAYGVWAAGIAGKDVAGWSIDILDNLVRYTGPAYFTGNLLLDITSKYTSEALLPAKVNFTNFDELPGVGRQFWPRIWSPVPEPSSFSLFAVGVILLIRKRSLSKLKPVC